MVLDAFEFIRRFLLHVLPDNFVKIRYYGLLSNKNRSKMLQNCRTLLGITNVEFKKNVETWQDKLLRLTGFDVLCCPSCNKGKMITVEIIEPVKCNSPPAGRNYPK